MLFCSLLLSSCNNWLDILPKNEQVTENYWQSKEDVEQVVASGYYYMRQTTPYLIDWGEIRGASIYAPYNKEKDKLQNFQLIASSSLCKWGTFYEVINMANSIIQYAPKAQEIDDTYTVEAMRSHQTEGYFMRALMYFYLVRNFKEVPLILEAYVDDSAPFSMAKSSEEVILAQIREDIRTALATGAAKEFFEHTSWKNPTKGRATRWALYALMADVCLWAEDYDECIEYADMLLNATSAYRPAFMSDGEQWFSIFEEGNSNESIFELNWDSQTYAQTSNSPSAFYSTATTSTYRFTTEMLSRLQMENTLITDLYNVIPYRGVDATYVQINDGSESGVGLLWKYVGSSVSSGVARTYSDANLIIYRMADVMLMKAEALIWKGQAYWEEAIEIVNRVRTRVNAPEIVISLSEEDELSMLEYVLEERDLELAGENKRWYDLIRFGKSKTYAYKSQFISLIIENNETANPSWLRSVLNNDYAWYLPIHEDEIFVNELLEQNPYYKTTE
ncbi:MAG: RagB/SusD family nutrient uptake outer membrane protein [Rikenellaceae bacterium]|nr:RagB/SusD family nutrient uptake outer membrane protein [Rikenellaceae bacterium]